MKPIRVTLDPDASEILRDAGPHHVAIIRKVGKRMELTSLPVPRDLARLIAGALMRTRHTTRNSIR